MFNYFPNEYLEDVYSIDYHTLHDLGFRGLIFDIDNTLVPHGAECTPEVEALFEKLNGIGFRTLLLSNNSQGRVEKFKKNLDALYIADADKPSPASFRKAVEMLGCRPEEVLVIGDTTHTDILGANRAGLKSILVKYIGYYKKEKKGIRRNLERVMLMLFPIFRKKPIF